MPYLSASAVVIHYEEALYQVYAPLPFTFAISAAAPAEDADAEMYESASVVATVIPT